MYPSVRFNTARRHPIASPRAQYARKKGRGGVLAQVCRSESQRSSDTRHPCQFDQLSAGRRTRRLPSRNTATQPANASRFVEATSAVSEAATEPADWSSIRRTKIPAWVPGGYRWRSPNPRSSVTTSRCTRVAARETVGSSLPERPSSSTVSTSWPASTKIDLARFGRFSSSLILTRKRQRDTRLGPVRRRRLLRLVCHRRRGLGTRR